MVVNGGLIMISGSIIPPPEGADMTTTEGLKAIMPELEPKHFLMPFLAHALGTLVGALIAVKIGATNHLRLAFIIAGVFLAGGIYMVATMPSPFWFSAVDLIGAYIPMGWLGWWISRTKS